MRGEEGFSREAMDDREFQAKLAAYPTIKWESTLNPPLQRALVTAREAAVEKKSAVSSSTSSGGSVSGGVDRDDFLAAVRSALLAEYADRTDALKVYEAFRSKFLEQQQRHEQGDDGDGGN